ncbi:MAG: hypothetical protein IJ770_01645 [Alphaproteobacteria bacterium]|nr:hypothetical protein [Alphaproteobacteria bacterium]
MNKIKVFFNDLRRRFDWHINRLTAIELLLTLLTVPMILWANPQWFTENGAIENTQLFVLLTAFAVALYAKKSGKLFVLAAFVVLFMIMRETNLFRAYFCEKYLSKDELCRWNAFKYGYLIESIRWIFAVYVLYYFIRHKIWRQIWQYILNAPVYVWDFMILGVSFIGGTVAEFECVDNEIMEESFELIFYITVVNCLYKYGKFTCKKTD